MRHLLLALVLAISPAALVAQHKSGLPKAPHSDINLLPEAYPADTLVEEDAIYVKAEGETTVQITRGDSVFVITDADGTDGEAALTLPTGMWDAYARPAGKPGRSAELNGQTFTRAKKKASWVAVTADLLSGNWVYRTTKLGLNIRFYQQKEAPAPAPSTDSSTTDSTKTDSTVTDSAR